MYKGQGLLGRLLRTKYINALKEIESTNDFLKRSPNSVKDYQNFFAEEKQYLASFKHELPEDLFMINYVELLELLFSKQEEFNKLNATTPDANIHEVSLHQVALVTSHIEYQRCTVLEQLINIQNAMKMIESERKIVRWT
ncbi:hypothetical protein FRC11_008488 [Ceratobasidium sp. 423]|nr:hypothetical protein FRC11_008488 [Ceratobasidium sp. 423]